MNLEPSTRAVLLPAAGFAALIFLGMWFGCGSDRVRPVDECSLRVDPVVFGDVTVGDTLVQDATVVNTGRNPLDLVATLESPDFRLAAGDSVPVSLAAGDSVHLSVAYAPQTIGTKSAEISFTGLDCPGVEVTGGTPKAIPGFVAAFSLGGGLSIAPIGITVDLDGVIVVDGYDGSGLRYKYPDSQITAYAISPDGVWWEPWGAIAWGPDGLAACPDGSVLMVDSGHGKVLKCSVGGGVLGQVGLSRWSPGRFDAPSDVTVDEDGFVYVADPETHRVQKFTGEGGFVASWTRKDVLLAVLDHPEVLNADLSGGVFVSGYLHAAWDHPILPHVARLSTAGQATSITRQYWVNGIASDEAGYLYLAMDDGIVKLTRDGQAVARLSTVSGFLDVAADSSGHLYAVTADSLYKLSTTGAPIATWPHGGVGVAFDETQGLFVLGADWITHLATDGEFLGKWGGSGVADGLFDEAGGIAVSPDGTVFVADTKNQRIQRLSPDGAFIGKFGNVSDEPGWLNGPVDAAVSADGFTYIATVGDNRINKFAPEGAFVTRWGGAGQEPGHLDSPRGVAVGGSGNVYVWDTGNHRIQVFDADGVFLRAWEPVDSLGAAEPWAASSDYGKSAGIAVTADDTVYLADIAAHRVMAFSAEGLPLGSWGGYGTGPSRFGSPRDIAIGADGRIYVLDYGELPIQVFQLQSP